MDANNKVREEANSSSENTEEEQSEEYMDIIEEHWSFKPSSPIDNDDDYCSSGYNLYFPGGRLHLQRDNFGNIIDAYKVTWISLRG